VFKGDTKEAAMELSVSLEDLCRIVLRLREYEAQVPAVDPDDGSNPSDDGDVSVLEDESNEAVEEELTAAIGDLDEDEAIEMVALALIGRGSFDASEWDDALEAATEEIASTSGNAAAVMMDMPMGASYVEAGLAAFDLSCDGFGQLS
jgi:hypothetical protein